MSGEKRTHEPHDRLTRLCAAMTDALEAHPHHHKGDKAIVMLSDGKRAGIELYGYDNDDDTEAIADLFEHLRAIMKANGKNMDVMFLGPDGIDWA